MLEALENDQGEIESFQLQLLCSYLEAKVKKTGQVITPADFGGKTGIDTILNDYYEREMGALDPAEQLAARRFIEEGLIVNGRRVGLPEGAEQSRFGIGPALLGKLLASRLLRTETIHLGKIYELSHDTLIDPILRSYEKRHAEEELRRAEQLLAEERTQLADVQRKRARARLFAIAGFVLFGLALLGGGFAWYNFQQAQKAQKRAEVTALATKAWNIYRDDQTLAFRIAQFAYESDTTNEEALQTVRKIVNEPTTAYYKTVFTGHVFEVKSLAFSPDGSQVASGGFDSEIYIWDRSGKRLHHFSHQKETGTQNSGSVEALQFSRDGRRLLSADITGEVRIWDIGADTLWRRFKTQRALTGMALSPDERLLVTCGQDSTARIWDLTGRLIRTLKGHNGPVLSVAFSPDNQLLATGSGDKTARIWSIDGALKKTIEPSGVSVINDVRFSPDSRTLALACNDNTARLYDREGRPMNTLSGHTAEVSRVLFSPDGKYLLTASFDHTAKLWTTAGEEVLRMVGHSERLSAAAFSPDGAWLATGSYDFQAKLWDLTFNLNNKFNRHSNYVNKVKVSPDGRFLISGSRDFTVKKWNFSGDLLASMEGHRTSVTSVDISPDGKTFVSTSNDKNIRLWTADGRALRTITDSRSDALKAVFTPDNQYLVSSNFIGEISVYEVNTGRLVRKWQASAGLPVQSVALSPDGQRVYSGGGDGVLRAWNIQGDSLWSAVIGVNIWSVAVSPDGRKILTAGYQLPIKIWDDSGRLIQNCYGHLMENYFVAWAPDGEQFVSCSWDRTAKIWDKNGRLLRTLPHPDGVFGADFSPDNKLVVTACRDRVIRVWETQTGRMVNTIGIRTDVRPFFQSPSIANLDEIVFDWEKFGISTALAGKIYQNKPENLVRHSIQLMEKAVANLGDFAGCRQYLSEAEQVMRTAKQADRTVPPAANYDSLVAEVYGIRANLFLLNKQFGQVVATARSGMKYKPLDFLKIYEVNGLLLEGKFEEAVQKATALKNEKITQISYYADMTFGEAFQEELLFYEDQYGIQCADKERFAERLK
jgi:WD40 repeat protein